VILEVFSRRKEGKKFKKDSYIYLGFQCVAKNIKGDFLKKRKGIFTLFFGFQSSFAIFTSSSSNFPFFSYQIFFVQIKPQKNFSKINRIFTLIKTKNFPTSFVEK